MNQKTRELNQSNNALDKQIQAENKEDFINMICYLRAANISAYHQELVRQDLTEMILSAQHRGENIHEVIGEDYREFCDNVISSLPPETVRQRVIDFFDTVCWCLSILGVINIIFSNETIPLFSHIITGKPHDFLISISLGSVILIGVIIILAFTITTLILKHSFQTETATKHRLKGFFFGAGMTSFFLLIAWLGRTTLFRVNIFIACAVVLTLFAAHKLLERI